MVDPLLISATASSAFLNTLEELRSIFGASVGCSTAVEYFALLRMPATGRSDGRATAVQRTPNWIRGRHAAAILRGTAIADIREVAIVFVQTGTDDMEERRDKVARGNWRYLDVILAAHPRSVTALRAAGASSGNRLRLCHPLQPSPEESPGCHGSGCYGVLSMQ